MPICDLSPAVVQRQCSFGMQIVSDSQFSSSSLRSHVFLLLFVPASCCCSCQDDDVFPFQFRRSTSRGCCQNFRSEINQWGCYFASLALLLSIQFAGSKASEKLLLIKLIWVSAVDIITVLSLIYTHCGFIVAKCIVSPVRNLWQSLKQIDKNFLLPICISPKTATGNCNVNCQGMTKDWARGERAFSIITYFCTLPTRIGKFPEHKLIAVNLSVVKCCKWDRYCQWFSIVFWSCFSKLNAE